MSINIGDNFSYLGKKFLDNREHFETVAKMKACNDVPNGFITYCDETNTRYEYHSDNPNDVTLGKWRVFKSVPDVNFDEYVTQDELEEAIKDVDVTTQLEDYAKKSELHSHDNKAILDGITQDKIDSWDKGGNVDLTSYAKIEDVPTKTSELTNDSGYLTGIPSEYVTETELEGKGFLTEHQSLSHLVTQDEFDELELIETSSTEPTDGDVVIWINTSEDTPTDILARINDDTVASNTTWSSGKINDTLNNLQLGGGSQNIDLSSYAKKGDIPTKTSQLTNDSNFLTSIPSEYVTDSELNTKGYATEGYVTNAINNAQLSGGNGEDIDLSDYALKTELHEHSNKSVLDNITSVKITSWDNKSTFSGNYNDLTNKPTIPTKTSQLTNDSNFLTSIPSEYITEGELSTKQYATEEFVQTAIDNAQLSGDSGTVDMTNYALKTELHNHNNKSLLDAITSGDITKWSQSIPFNDTYASDCNTWLTNGYIKTGAGQTSNLPSVCTGADRWGILFFVAENATQGTGTQMYFPIDGTYKGRVFVRSLTNMTASGTSVGAWTLLSTFSGDYNDLTNKPTINIVKMTESQYNALTTKDSNTLYIII